MLFGEWSETIYRDNERMRYGVLYGASESNDVILRQSISNEPYR